MYKMLLISVHGVSGRPVAVACTVCIPNGAAIRRCYAYFIPQSQRICALFCVFFFLPSRLCAFFGNLDNPLMGKDFHPLITSP
jgi:hypothetical protein